MSIDTAYAATATDVATVAASTGPPWSTSAPITQSARQPNAIASPRNGRYADRTGGSVYRIAPATPARPNGRTTRPRAATRTSPRAVVAASAATKVTASARSPSRPAA